MVSVDYALRVALQRARSIKKFDDTWRDRLTYKHTSVAFFTIAAAIFARNYFGEPIQCWVPSEFNDMWEAFAEKYCFVENTYFVGNNASNLPKAETRESQEIIYYQWVPFYLFFFGILSIVPKLTWIFFSEYAELDVNSMIAASRDARVGDVDQFEKRKEVFKLEVYRRANREERDRTYLWKLYLLMKVLMLIFAGVIFNWIYSFHPVQVDYFHQLFDIHRWQNTGFFPRTVFCDFPVRELGQTNNYSVQCVLVVNMFNEKIFIASLIWITGIFFMNIIDFGYWFKQYWSSDNRKYIAELLQRDSVDKHEYDSFIKGMIKTDGILVIKLIDSNAGRHEAQELVNTLWDLHFSKSSVSTPTEFFHTTKLLLFLMTLTLTRIFVRKSMTCWAPAQFKATWIGFAESYCMVENTYFVPLNDTNVPTPERRRNEAIVYYQWVPYILIVLTAIVVIPRMIWFLTKVSIGFNYSELSKTTVERAQLCEDDCDFENVKRKVIKTTDNGYRPRWSGNRLTVIIGVFKISQTISVIIAWIFLFYSMGMGPLFGAEIVYDALNGINWLTSGVFPRVTFCDVDVRHMGNMHRWTMQCVLTDNMLYEKIFVFLWFYFLALIFMSFVDLTKFVVRVLSKSNQRAFVSSILIEQNENATGQISAFTRKVLKNDGVLLLHLIKDNSTVYQAGDILTPLWNDYISKND